MNSTDANRLLTLERLFRSGATLTGAETWELERLRDQAGQGDLFPAVAPELPLRDRDTVLIDRDTVLELASARLIGHDGGEQTDAFGQGLLI